MPTAPGAFLSVLPAQDDEFDVMEPEALRFDHMGSHAGVSGLGQAVTATPCPWGSGITPPPPLAPKKGPSAFPARVQASRGAASRVDGAGFHSTGLFILAAQLTRPRVPSARRGVLRQLAGVGNALQAQRGRQSLGAFERSRSLARWQLPPGKRSAGRLNSPRKRRVRPRRNSMGLSPMQDENADASAAQVRECSRCC